MTASAHREMTEYEEQAVKTIITEMHKVDVANQQKVNAVRKIKAIMKTLDSNYFYCETTNKIIL